MELSNGETETVCYCEHLTNFALIFDFTGTAEVGEDYAWLDISVDNANELSSFYQKVLGWEVEEISMGTYSDYSMVNPNTKEAVSGICHAKGYNAKMPPM